MFQPNLEVDGRAVEIALQEGERDPVASYRAARAVREAVCGSAAEGTRSAMAALELSKGRDVQYAARLALALSGDSARSQLLADDLERRTTPPLSQSKRS